MTAPKQSISPGTAGLQHVWVIAYPLGECSSEAVTVSTKARKRVGFGWPCSFCAEITMPKRPFLPSDFTATKFSTAADKAEFGNTLLRFIESEWAPALFTKGFYNRLSMCFSHIANYVECVIMRRACVNTLWIQSSTASSLCIILTIELSAASQLPGGRSLYRKVKVCIPAARFEPWRG
jgi:hypothetical protein